MARTFCTKTKLPIQIKTRVHHSQTGGRTDCHRKGKASLSSCWMNWMKKESVTMTVTQRMTGAAALTVPHWWDNTNTQETGEWRMRVEKDWPEVRRWWWTRRGKVGDGDLVTLEWQNEEKNDDWPDGNLDVVVVCKPYDWLRGSILSFTFSLHLLHWGTLHSRNLQWKQWTQWKQLHSIELERTFFRQQSVTPSFLS